MEIKEMCEMLLKIYEKQTNENDRLSAVQIVYKLGFEINRNNFTLEDLNQILVVTIQIAKTKKRLQQILEEKLLGLISFLPHKLWMENEEKPRFYRGTKSKEGEIANSLISFAEEIYEIRVDRDSFAGKRRGYAIQILESLTNYFEVPEFLIMCRKSIKSKSKNEFLYTIESLKNYYLETGQLPEEEIIKEINTRIAKTKSRSEIVGGLNLQVEAGIIDELEALSRVDEWKEKYYR